MYVRFSHATRGCGETSWQEEHLGSKTIARQSCQQWNVVEDWPGKLLIVVCSSKRGTGWLQKMCRPSLWGPKPCSGAQAIHLHAGVLYRFSATCCSNGVIQWHLWRRNGRGYVCVAAAMTICLSAGLALQVLLDPSSCTSLPLPTLLLL